MMFDKIVLSQSQDCFFGALVLNRFSKRKEFSKHKSPFYYLYYGKES